MLGGHTVFLDRDGTLNRKPPEGSYITNPVSLELLPGAAEALRILNAEGALTIVVTNQRGIARGLMTEDDLADVHHALTLQLESQGAKVDAIYHCPHDIGQCDCRKPEVGMLLRAAEEIPNAQLAGGVLIGDSDSDVEAALRAGLVAVAIGDRACAPERIPHFREADLRDAVRTLKCSPEPRCLALAGDRVAR